MKTIRIRTFLVLAFILISTLPWIAFVIAHLILTKRLTFEPQGTPNRVAPDQAIPIVPMDMWQGFAVVFGFLLAAVVIAILMRQFMIKPLEAMRLAAGQIATGDLAVDDLAKSRIREIAAVSDGFEAMIDALQHSYQKQIALEEERTFVINSVAHDLRTPLFALRGYLDGLEKGIANTPDKMMMYVAVCKESSDQLDRLVADLFAFTNEGQDGFEIQTDAVDIVDVVMKAAESLRIAADKKEISISINAHSGHPYVHGDRHLLARLTNNVIENAVRHTPEGRNVQIQILTARGKVHVSVHDSGAGFSEADLLHVFEPFYRGEESRNRACGGAGLGLTIAERIVQRHGGDISVDNSPTGGGIVTFWLPEVNAVVT